MGSPQLSQRSTDYNLKEAKIYQISESLTSVAYGFSIYVPRFASFWDRHGRFFLFVNLINPQGAVVIFISYGK